MEATIFLAKFWAIYFIVMAIAVLINPKRLKAIVESIFKSDSEMWIAGVFTFLLGIGLVLTHNVWDTTLEIVVSVIGWLTLVKGIMYVTLPDTIKNLGKNN